MSIINVDGSDQRNLAEASDSTATGMYWSSWSPDGVKLSFIDKESSGRGQSYREEWSLWVMNMNTSDKRELLTSESPISSPSWSPDGSRIAFRRNESVFSICIDGDDEEEHVTIDVSTWPLGDMWQTEYKVRFQELWVQSAYSNAACSPDGNWLAISAGKSYQDIYLLGPGNRVIKLQLEGTWATDPSWARTEVTPTPVVPPAPTTATEAKLEVANLNHYELTELREVVEEVLAQAKLTANEDESLLLSQSETILEGIAPDSELRDIVREKTEEERLILDLLEGIFTVGAKYFYKIPSLIAGAIAEGAEELGNQIAEWQVLGQLSFARVTQPDSGIMEVVYHKELGEVWIDFDIYNPVGRVCMYIPVGPALVSPEGGGNILLAEGVKPLLQNCRIAYQFGK